MRRKKRPLFYGAVSSADEPEIHKQGVTNDVKLPLSLQLVHVEVETPHLLANKVIGQLQRMVR